MRRATPSRQLLSLLHDYIMTAPEFRLCSSSCPPGFTHASWTNMYRLICLHYSSTIVQCSDVQAHDLDALFFGVRRPGDALLTVTFPDNVFGLLRFVFLPIVFAVHNMTYKIYTTSQSQFIGPFLQSQGKITWNVLISKDFNISYK